MTDLGIVAALLVLIGTAAMVWLKHRGPTDPPLPPRFYGDDGD